MTTQLEATVETDESVALLATDIPLDVDRVRFMRTCCAGKTMLRGGETSVAGAASIVDYYPPLGREIEYTLETPSGRVLTSTTITVESDTGFIRDALVPTRKIPIHATYQPRRGGAFLREGAFQTRKHTAEGKITPIVGSRVGVWTGSIVRPSEIKLNLFVEGRDLEHITRLCAESVLCLQTLPGWGLSDPVAYFPSDADFHAHRPWDPSGPVSIDITVQPVRPPLVAPVVSAVLVSTIDEQALDLMLTVADVDANAAGRSVAEVDLRPGIITGEG